MIQRKQFDTSGKSPALIHHHAICKTLTVLPDNGLLGAIAGQCLSLKFDSLFLMGPAKARFPADNVCHFQKLYPPVL
jgi:hypothetical protein